MVDLICLCQAYKRCEITKVKWISSRNNPVDAIIKAKPCQAFKTLINTNKLNLKVIEWVE
jgi:site-specific DNA-cytosine methylase